MDRMQQAKDQQMHPAVLQLCVTNEAISVNFEGRTLDSKVVHRSQFIHNLALSVECPEGAEVTLPFRSDAFSKWYFFKSSASYCTAELCDVIQVASFLEDSQCHTDAINVLVAGIREGLWAEMRRCMITYDLEQLWSAEFAWKAVQSCTDAVHSLPSGDRQCVAAQFLLEEIIAAPAFFLEAYLNGVAPSGELDLSGLSFCGSRSEGSEPRLSFTRVLIESVQLGFRRLVLPAASYIPELHAPCVSFQPFTTVTSVQFTLVADPAGIVRMLELLPNLQSISAFGDGSRLSLEEARGITRLLPSLSCLKSVDMSGSRLPSKAYNSFCIGLSECAHLTTLHMSDNLTQGHIACHSLHVLDNTLSSLTALQCLTYRAHAVDGLVVACVQRTLEWVMNSFPCLETLNLEVSLEHTRRAVSTGQLIETMSSWWSSDAVSVPTLRNLKCVIVAPTGQRCVESLLPYASITPEQKRQYRLMAERLDIVEIVVKNACNSSVETVVKSVESSSTNVF